LELFRLDPVMRATHAGAGIRLFAFGYGHDSLEGLGSRSMWRTAQDTDCGGRGSMGVSSPITLRNTP
jgi:hypothetical protein